DLLDNGEREITPVAAEDLVVDLRRLGHLHERIADVKEKRGVAHRKNCSCQEPPLPLDLTPIPPPGMVPPPRRLRLQERQKGRCAHATSSPLPRHSILA